MTQQLPPIPGAVRRRSSVVAPAPRKEGGSLKGFITYNTTLDRVGGEFACTLQWVDLEEQGHTLVMPHRVFMAIVKDYESIMKVARSDRARAAAATRKAKRLEKEKPSDD